MKKIISLILMPLGVLILIKKIAGIVPEEYIYFWGGNLLVGGYFLFKNKHRKRIWHIIYMMAIYSFLLFFVILFITKKWEIKLMHLVSFISLFIVSFLVGMETNGKIKNKK